MSNSLKLTKLLHIDEGSEFLSQDTTFFVIDIETSIYVHSLTRYNTFTGYTKNYKYIEIINSLSKNSLSKRGVKAESFATFSIIEELKNMSRS